MQDILNISRVMKIIGDLLTTEFLPIEKKRLLALHPKPGGLGIPLFSDISDTKYEKLKFLTIFPNQVLT